MANEKNISMMILALVAIIAVIGVVIMYKGEGRATDIRMAQTGGIQPATNVYQQPATTNYQPPTYTAPAPAPTPAPSGPIVGTQPTAGAPSTIAALTDQQMIDILKDLLQKATVRNVRSTIAGKTEWYTGQTISAKTYVVYDVEAEKFVGVLAAHVKTDEELMREAFGGI